jgi:hypothetical protein
MLSMRGGAKGLGPWGSLRTTKLYGRTKERLTQEDSAGNVFFAFTRNRYLSGCCERNAQSIT